MFLFVYSDREPVLFVPALEVARASQIVTFPVFGYMDSEILGKKSNLVYLQLTARKFLLNLTTSM